MIEENRNIIKRESNRRKIRFFIAMVFLLVLVLLLASLSLILGNTSYSLSVVFDVLKGEEIKGATFAIRTLRLPRMLAGLLAGISFGMAGNTFQTMLRNPLASPDIIGVTSGTSVAFCGYFDLYSFKGRKLFWRKINSDRDWNSSNAKCSDSISFITCIPI